MSNMVWNASASGSMSERQWEESVNPWAAQDPYLQQGFAEAARMMGQGPYQGNYWVDPNYMQQAAMAGGYGASDPTGIMSRLYGMGDMGMARYGDSLNYMNQAMQGRSFDNPYGGAEYNDMVSANRWTDADQQMADRLGESAQIGFERSDFGDRGAAAMSGLGGGSDYQISRGLAAADTNRALGLQLGNLERSAEQRAYGTANQWAGQQVQNQYADWAARDNAAAQLYGAGRAGMGDMTGAYNFGQQGYGNMAGWGDYQYGFDRDRMMGGQQQWDAGWDPVRNFWNIVGQNSWGSETTGSESTQSFEGSAGWG